MTTKVTVDAHAGWPVEVEIIDIDHESAERAVSVEIVQPNEVRDFYVFDTRQIHVTELRKPE